MKSIPKWTRCTVQVDGRMIGPIGVMGTAPEARREPGTLTFSAAFPDERDIYNCWVSAEPFRLTTDDFQGDFRVMSVEFGEIDAKPALVVHVVRPDYFEVQKAA